MRRFWLLFAQTVTIALALYFVYGALRPASRVQQLGSAAKPVPVVETASSSLAPGSYRDAAARAMPAVVNILINRGVNNSSYDEPMSIPMIKKDGEWKVALSELSRKVYPSLP